MSVTGQFSSKNPTVKRILREAAELATQPSSDYHAAPLETDLFEWHFTLRGPPAPSPYESGIYHGRIVLPPAYPLKPPSFRFLTASGRFEVNREICLSISGHHEETWQPAWGIRTALVAIRSFMDTNAKGQLGGMDATDEVRRRFAGQSAASRCPTCSKSNGEIMKDHDTSIQALGEERVDAAIDVPQQLRLSYKGETSGTTDQAAQASSSKDEPLGQGATQEDIRREPPPVSAVISPEIYQHEPVTGEHTFRQEQLRRQRIREEQRRAQRRIDENLPVWLNPAIYAIMAALMYLLWRKFM
jgi:ubiquitin-conjugating enzyme E2 J1